MAYINPTTGEIVDPQDITAECINEDTVIADGRNAARVGGNYDHHDNPYPDGSHASNLWEDGWYGFTESRCKS